tara:strand:+ start:5008 stop:5781 length:774 start_codon:yes stop_codon:yes gene_type:complete
MKFIILGCGSSMGVPRPDGFFGDCNAKNKKNFRLRCSALIKSKYENILIDTSPDLREQLLNNNIKNIDRVLYSHQHADQTHGINDLRVFYINKNKEVPLYADKQTSKYLKDNFSYCFKYNSTIPKSLDYPATLKLNVLKKVHKFSNLQIKSIKVNHGNIDSICFIINNKCAYASDVKFFYKNTIHHLKNIKYLIIDCLRYNPHPSHFNLNELLEFIKIIKPKKTILTNLSTQMDYDKLKRKLPKNMVPAYDGLTINL